MRLILETVRRHGTVMAAARDLGCSDAYIHVRLKEAGLTLRRVLEASTLEDLLPGVPTHPDSKTVSPVKPSL
ncbi:MAG: hypothetical protein HY681_15120 [Chloroflexi bacterium]|nr:hypothetical protein [Chloroflexota bacterium]